MKLLDLSNNLDDFGRSVIVCDSCSYDIESGFNGILFLACNIELMAFSFLVKQGIIKQVVQYLFTH